MFTLQDCWPAEPYRHRVTRFDNPFAAEPFPADALPVDAHWGTVERGATHTRSDWIVRPAEPLPAS